jgi:hypothetical protein
MCRPQCTLTEGKQHQCARFKPAAAAAAAHIGQLLPRNELPWTMVCAVCEYLRRCRSLLTLAAAAQTHLWCTHQHTHTNLCNACRMTCTYTHSGIAFNQNKLATDSSHAHSLHQRLCGAGSIVTGDTCDIMTGRVSSANNLDCCTLNWPTQHSTQAALAMPALP